MTLSDEDKRRIEREEEERYRSEIRSKLEKANSSKPKELAFTNLKASPSNETKSVVGKNCADLGISTVVIIATIVLMFLLSLLPDPKKSTPAQVGRPMTVEEQRQYELQNHFSYEQYDIVISKGTPYVDSDVKIKKMVEDAKAAKELKAVRLIEAREKVTRLFKEGKFKDAWQEAKSFPKDEELKSLSEKAYAKYKTKEEVRLLAEAKAIPPADFIKNIEIYQSIVDLFPENPAYAQKLKYYQEKYAKVVEAIRLRESSQLELLKYTFTLGDSYAIAEGQVKNITAASINNIEAVVSYFDKNGNFITSDSSLIEYRPLLPGQISPFKVYTPLNPAMKKGKMEFKLMWGKKLTVYSDD